MTLIRREEILSKDILGVQDVMELNDMQYFNAAKLIRNIKRKTTCGLDIRGKVSTAVYLDYFEPKTNEVVKEERKERVVASKKIRTKEIPPFRFKDYQGVQQ